MSELESGLAITSMEDAVFYFVGGVEVWIVLVYSIAAAVVVFVVVVLDNVVVGSDKSR